jgi:hypothetical protein
MEQTVYQYIIPVISALTPLFAVIYGPRKASKDTRKQIVLPMREKWISGLRSIIVENLTILDSHIFASKFDLNVTKSLLDDRQLEKLLFNTNMMKLMLNLNESILNDLIGKMADLNTLVTKTDDDEFLSKYNTSYKDVIDISQRLLKTEWNRIQNWKTN